MGRKSSSRNRSVILALALIWMAVMASNSVFASALYQITAKTEMGAQSWRIELASTPESRSRGLMFVESMPSQTGMLFRFDDSRKVSMWMKNTFISLDMIFLTQSGKVAHVHRSAVPHSLEIIPSRYPVRYVLEINAGEADETGLKRGTQMRHPWFAVEH